MYKEWDATLRRHFPRRQNWGRRGKCRLRCIQVYSVVNRTSCEVWKIKPRRTAASVEYTAASVVRCSHKTTAKCLWRARRYTPETEVNPPGNNPLGHNPVFCCRRTSWDRTRRVFLLKTDTNPYSWPYPTHEAGSWPQPTHERQQTCRGLWPRGVCSGFLVGHRRRQ